MGQELSDRFPILTQAARHFSLLTFFNKLP